MKKLFSSLLFVLPFFAFAQEETPYFQQEVNYTIHVKLDDVKHELNADISMEYINNSPDWLDVIYIHLWPNAYKNHKTALAIQQVQNGETKLYYAKEENRGYIDSLNFKVNGVAVRWEYDSKNIDICKLVLVEPLKPKGKLTIATPFHVKIPLGEYSRLGHLGQSYQITQWYPKPAVYDKNGWNPMPYLDQGEFYSEFGSFDVSITLPKNYVVGATGDMVGGEAELKWLNEIAEQTKNKTSFGDGKTFPKSSDELKTLRFKQSKVHDFAWFADKRYNVLKGEVEMPESKRKVTTWAMFTDGEADLWSNSIEYLNDATLFYSQKVGEYPYNHVTAVDGALSAGGGMEYPNITVIGSSGDKRTLEQTIMHEVGHNWFYGILGSNERVHPWLDEGFNSFIEARYMENKYPNGTFADVLGGNLPAPISRFLGADKFPQESMGELGYLFSARHNLDQPVELHAADYMKINYGTIVYMKSALIMDYLMGYLGEEKMDAIMHNYFDQWKFKHPQPEDFKKVAEERGGKLDWFFDDMVNTSKKLDYSVCSVKKDEERKTWKLKVHNCGKINGPVSITAYNKDSVMKTEWFDGFTDSRTLEFPEGDYDKFIINEKAPEIDKNNNTIRTKGMMRTIEPLQIKFLGTLERSDRTQLFWSPVIGWNNYNKTLLGAVFYNSFFPANKLDYTVMPLYGTGNNDFAGYFNVGYTFRPAGSFLQELRIGVAGQRYGYFYRPDVGYLNYNVLKPEISFSIKKDPRSSITQSFRFRHISVSKEIPTFDAAENGYVGTGSYYYVNDYTQTFVDNRKINPWSGKINVQQGRGFVKASIEAKYRISFKGKNKGFDIRLFAGQFFIKNNTGPYRFRMAGQRGFQDYLFDDTFLGRTDAKGVFSQQFTETDGNFKVPTGVGQTDDWLIALNLKTSIHKKIPLNIYADFGTYKNAANAYPGSKAIMINAGLSVPVVPNVFEVYFPLLSSSDINDNLELTTKNYWQRIRFTLNFNNINPLKRVRAIKPN